MKQLGEEIPGYKLRDIIKEVDVNQNGTVEFDEFLEVSGKVLKIVHNGKWKGSSNVRVCLCNRMTIALMY